MGVRRRADERRLCGADAAGTRAEQRGRLAGTERGLVRCLRWVIASSTCAVATRPRRPFPPPPARRRHRLWRTLRFQTRWTARSSASSPCLRRRAGYLKLKVTLRATVRRRRRRRRRPSSSSSSLARRWRVSGRRASRHSARPWRSPAAGALLAVGRRRRARACRGDAPRAANNGGGRAERRRRRSRSGRCRVRARGGGASCGSLPADSARRQTGAAAAALAPPAAEASSAAASSSSAAAEGVAFRMAWRDHDGSFAFYSGRIVGISPGHRRTILVVARVGMKSRRRAGAAEAEEAEAGGEAAAAEAAEGEGEGGRRRPRRRRRRPKSSTWCLRGRSSWALPRTGRRRSPPPPRSAPSSLRSPPSRISAALRPPPPPRGKKSEAARRAAHARYRRLSPRLRLLPQSRCHRRRRARHP